MKKRLVSLFLVFTLILALIPQISINTFATSNTISYEVRKEVLEFSLKDGTLYYKNTIEYPYFSGNSPVEIAINSRYAALIENYKNQTRDLDAEYEEMQKWNPNGLNGLPFYDNVLAEVTYCENGFISINESIETWSGGNRPYMDYKGCTYRISDGQKLTLVDILGNSNSENEALITKYKKGIVDSYNADIILASPFILTADGLCFLVNIGDSVPREEVVIPYSEISFFHSAQNEPSEGTLEYNGHKYKLITEEMSWDDAEAYCISLGGHLVTITSAEENSFVQSLISTSTMIGLSDAAEEGAWEWITGESLTYTNWAENEPNNQSNEDYVLMQVKGTWNDGHLDREKWPFICEWDGTTLSGKTYSVEEIEQMVTDYFNANYQDTNNPGKFVVFHGETSVKGNMCSIVVRFQSSSNSPNTAANVLFAYVSVNIETGIMTIEGAEGGTDIPLFDPSTDDEITEVPDAIQFKITTDHTSLSVRKNNKLLLGASLTIDGMQIDDTSGITFQIEDSSILEVSASFSKDNCLYVSFNALKEGTTNVLFSDSASGAVAMIPVTVYSDSYLCYTLSSVPTKQIEKYPTNFYNINGLYIDSYTYTVNSDKSASVSFDVYNSNYTYGAIEVYDVNGNLKSAVLINKMSSSMTSMKEVLWDDVVYLVRDIYDGDLLSYRQESGFSKKTSISVTVPENGYIKICNDPENSFIVSLVNAADLLLSLASFMGEVKDYDVNSAYFSEKLTTKLVNEKIFAECVKDGSKLPKKLWSNVGEASISSPAGLASSCDSLVQNISELDLEDVIIETAMDFGINVGEETFTYFAGPFGAALKAIFAIGEIENILVQHAHMTCSAGIGSIYIQNQGGGILGSQQITVESEDGFEIDTALRVFSVTLDPDMLSKIKNTTPELYEAIEKKSSYTYDISLIKNGDTTQPGKSVTVCIPIPEAWRVPMPDDLKKSIYDGLFKIYRIEEDGTTTEIPIDVKDGCFVFETDHFSLYTLAKFDVENINDNIGFNMNSFWSWMIFVITIGICGCVLVVVCVLKSKKKKHS